MIILDIIYNLSILVVLCILSGFIDDRFDRFSLAGKVVQGLLFGAIAVIGMMYPYVYAEGLFFDGRSVVISLGTLFFGPVTGVISALITAGYRAYIGGIGVTTGVLTVFSSFLIGWAFHYFYYHLKPRVITKTGLYLFGLTVHVGMILMMAALPMEHMQDIFANLGITILLAYPIITLLIGKIFFDQQVNKQHVKNLSESEKKFRLLVESTEDVIFTLDREMRFTGVYGEWPPGINASKGELQGKAAGDVLENEHAENHEKRFREALDGRVVQYEWVLSGEEETYYLMKLSPIRNEKDEIIGLVAVGRNITDLKQAQNSVAQSLREKDVLLAEVHHRVKNNMAIISSLLMLQKEYIDVPEYQDFFVETENRVRSMGLVHEIVYEQADFSEIDMGDLLDRLIALILESYGLDNRGISVQNKTKDVSLDMKQSIPCTLLINELISNSCKHAFNKREGGMIEILFHKIPKEERSKEKAGKKRFELCVRDNGIGVSDVKMLQKPDSFGYTIIHGLVRQLRGTLHFDNSGQGLAVNIRF